MKNYKFIYCLPIVFLAIGCASKSIAERELQEKAQTIYQLDVNKDGKTDCLWAKNILDARNPITLWRKDDLNYDGKFDVEQYYDSERLSTEKMDLDYDGVFDAFNYYEDGQLTKSEFALTPSGKIDMWVFYKDGKPVKKEVDTRKTGRPDYFEFYSGSKIDRIGKDTDGDGVIDTWE